MRGLGRGPGAARRWLCVALGVGALLSLPSIVAALPASGGNVSATVLLSRVRTSGGVPHEGYAESTARLGLPDVPRIGETLRLLGETTGLRVWRGDSRRWRVDALTPIGEHGTYRDVHGTWRWDSFERRADRTEGEPVVRLARPADLTPGELGVRLAAAARPEEASRIPARRVAGRSAPGLRLTPQSPDTTVDHVDIWADRATGLPLRVEVTARGRTAPTLTTAFLDLRLRRPAERHLDFTPPADVERDVGFFRAPDVAARVEAVSPYVVPDALAGRRRRSLVGSAAGTYGEGFALVAVLTLPEHLGRRIRHSLDDRPLTPTIRGPYGDATLINTPLLTGLVVVKDDRAYVLSGTVPPRVLEEVATDLTRRPPELRQAQG